MPAYSKLDLFQPPGLATVYYVRDKRLKFKSGEQVDWPFDLTPEERKLGLDGLRQRYALANLKDVGDVLSPTWPPESLKKYDQVTVSDLRREMGISPEVEALLRFVSGASPIWSSLQAIRAAVQSLPRKQYFKIRGGNDLLPKAFAARLADKINYGAPVVRIEQDEKSVHVVIQQAGIKHTVTGDYLICAIPFTLLRNIEVAPSFSPDKRTAIEQMIFTSASKVFLQVKKRFWLDENLNGFASTDLPIGQVWNAVNEQPGTRGILLSYAAHLNSPRITSMKEEERVRFALEHMEKVYPGLHKYFEGGVSHCWDDDPWARGATPAFKPGQVTTLLPHIARPEGRVHFAGDHTSVWFEGWMQCALESGNRAATEINNAPDRKRA